MKWWTVRVLPECEGSPKDYRVKAADPMDARIIAFALDGGFPNQYQKMQEGDVALVQMYTEIINES